MKFHDTDCRRSALARWGIWLLAIAFLAGCSSSSEERRSGTVSGKVTLDGAALAAGTVLFMTEDGHGATADLQPDGTYTLQCRPDQYKVAVSPPPPPDPLAGGGAAPAAAVDIPTKYHDFAKSGLTTEVKEGENTFDISLTKK